MIIIFRQQTSQQIEFSKSWNRTIFFHCLDCLLRFTTVHNAMSLFRQNQAKPFLQTNSDETVIILRQEQPIWDFLEEFSEVNGRGLKIGPLLSEVHLVPNQGESL